MEAEAEFIIRTHAVEVRFSLTSSFQLLELLNKRCPHVPVDPRAHRSRECADADCHADLNVAAC
jgi:hypothetical protein